MKHRILILAVFSLLLVGSVARVGAQDSIGAFRYQPEKVKVGVVYHYLKTNIDGTVPEHVSIYIASKDKIESFKFHPKGSRAGLVIANMDWSTFSVNLLESWQVFADKPKVLVATLKYLQATRGVEVHLHFANRPRETVNIPYLPFHVYNFDLASLNFAFRHLVDPKKTFTVGISDPTFKDDGPSFRYRGEVQIKYAGDENRHGAPSRKYLIDGPGLEDRGGTIWVDKDGGYFRDVEISLPDNPNWQTFKFKLQKIQEMSQAQWEGFMKAQF